MNLQSNERFEITTLVSQTHSADETPRDLT
jgi:hypothetical protein